MFQSLARAIGFGADASDPALKGLKTYRQTRRPLMPTRHYLAFLMWGAIPFHHLYLCLHQYLIQ
jgi:hypothetical protein